MHTYHYSDVIISEITSQITGVSIVYSIICSEADRRKNQCSALMAFVREIHRSPVNSPHKGSVTRKMFPFDDVIMQLYKRHYTMTASVSMMTNVQENCYLLSGFYLKHYWCLNDYPLSSATVSHDFIYNAVPLTHCYILYVICMILWNVLSEMT